MTAVQGGGTTVSQTFTVGPDEIVRSSDFQEDGFDSNSIVFSVSDKIPEGWFVVGQNQNDQYVRFEKSTPARLKALVFCENGGQTLVGSLEAYSKAVFSEEDILSRCGETEFSPCCLIEFKRATE